MRDVLDGLLEPAAEDRPSIEEARMLLEQKEDEFGLPAMRKASYESGRVKIERSYGSLVVTILPDKAGLMNAASTG